MSWVWFDDADADTANDAETIIINPRTIETTSFACPTIFEMRDTTGTSYYFRLRNGGWRFVNESMDETIASGTAPGDFDGVCDFDEALEMIRSEHVNIIKGEWN